METFSALLAICAGNSPASGEFPAQRPVTRSFDVFFDMCLNKRLRKQSWGWWFETLYAHYDVIVMMNTNNYATYRAGWVWRITEQIIIFLPNQKHIDQLKALGTESCYNAKIVATGDIITTHGFKWYDTDKCGMTYLLQNP